MIDRTAAFHQSTAGFYRRQHSEGRTEESVQVIRKLASPEAIRALYRISIAIDLLNRFVEFFGDEMRAENDEIFSADNGSPKLPVPDLVRFHFQLRAGTKPVPVVTICMYCKSIKDQEETWRPLERVLAVLDRQSAFSHGICPQCEDSAEKDSKG